MAYYFYSSDDDAGHGGECCGIANFYGFNSDEGDHDTTYTSIQGALDRMGHNRLAEIVLIDSQMEQMPDLVRDMKAAGFVLVNRFRNSNSGNICNVFHHVPAREPLAGAPGWTRRVHIEGGVAGEPVAEPTVVHRTYHNRYRDGRVGAGYDTEAAARDARRGTGPVIERRIYSDGGRNERELPAR